MRFADFLKDQRIVKPQRFIQKPLVSVIMPTYCRAHDGLLARAIRSVLTQTFSDFEFIVVDDGSVDGSEDVIRDFQKQDDRILYVRHEVNSGLAALRADEGILLGRADYVAVQTDDDEWLRPFLQTVLREAVEKNKPFVHSQAEWLLQGKVHRSPFPVTRPTYLSLIQGNKIGHSSTLMRTSILREIGLYDPHVILRRWTDWGLWLRVARVITPYMVPEVLVRVYGKLPDSMGIQTPTVEYEDFMLVLQVSRNADLTPESILGYDVMSLDRYTGKLPPETICSFYRSLVLPWLTQREEQLVKLGVSSEEITNVKQEIAGYSTGIEKTVSPRKKLSSGIAGIRRLVGRLLQPFPPLLRLAEALYRFLWSIIVIWKSALGPQNDTYDALPSGFQRIKGDTSMLDYRKHGFILNKSCNLQDVPFLSYKISVTGGTPCAILLALAVGEPKERGAVAIALVSEENQIVGYVGMPVFCMDSEKPAEFFFEPPLKPGKYCIRVFSKNLNVPVYILEFTKYRLIRRLFCGLVLDG